jgi:hypothetical protein
MGTAAIIKWLITSKMGRGLLVATIIGLLYLGAKAAWNEYTQIKEEVGKVTQQLKQKNEEYTSLEVKHTTYKEGIHAQIQKERRDRDILLADIQNITERNHELSTLLSKHDLTHLAEVKPTLIERRINAGTKRVLRELEQATRRSSGGASTTTTE